MKNQKMQYKLICIAFCTISFILISAFSFLCFAIDNLETNVTKITLVSNVYNAVKNVSNTYIYAIIPDENNLGGVRNEPQRVEVTFTNERPNLNKFVTQCVDIDFSNTIYTKPGIYKYLVYEVSSSNNETYPKSEQKFEIYVWVLNENGKLTINVQTRPVDEEDGVKAKSLEFNHKMVIRDTGGNSGRDPGGIGGNPEADNGDSSETSKGGTRTPYRRRVRSSNVLPLTGIFLNLMPFIIIIAIMIVAIAVVIYLRTKEKVKKREEYEDSE